MGSQPGQSKSPGLTHLKWKVTMVKRLICSLAVCLFISSAFLSLALAEKNSQAVVFHAHGLSADFNNKALKEVLNYFTKGKDIWVKGDETLLNEKISSHFQNLSLEDGLKRILNRFNYGILYAKNGDPLGVYIFGKGNVNNIQLESTDRQQFQFNEKEDVEVIVNCPPPGGLDKAEAETIKQELFTIQKNVPPPGGPVSITPEEQKVFRIQKNVPPPGGPFVVTPEEKKLFNIQGNAPAGESVSTTPEKHKNINIKPPANPSSRQKPAAVAP
jgi:hypothetical protein